METILLVEDTSFFEKAVTRLFQKVDGFRILVAKTYAQAEELLAEHGEDLFAALVDLTLPDTTDIEIVDLTVSRDIPTIVFSSRYDEVLRGKILDKGVVDYVLKDSPASLGYLRELVFRLRSNREVTALVVDDSALQRRMIGERLQRLQLKVLTASSGAEALSLVKTTPGIRLVVLDYIMEDMDGIQLLKQIRSVRGPDAVAVMGLSGIQDDTSMARFLKFGANDFLSKSCSPEEFMLRVGQNLDMIERIAELTETANRDSMTGLRNRRYLFEAGQRSFDACRKAGNPATVALIDIDLFKTINDTYGHEAGDMVIKELAQELRDGASDTQIAVRLGGDEFCLVMPGWSEEDAAVHCREIYTRFCDRAVRHQEQDLPVTLSIGLSTGYEDSLDHAIRIADERMYVSKNRGRNCISTSRTGAGKSADAPDLGALGSVRAAS